MVLCKVLCKVAPSPPQTSKSVNLDKPPSSVSSWFCRPSTSSSSYPSPPSPSLCSAQICFENTYSGLTMSPVLNIWKNNISHIMQINNYPTLVIICRLSDGMQLKFKFLAWKAQVRPFDTYSDHLIPMGGGAGDYRRSILFFGHSREFFYQK